MVRMKPKYDHGLSSNFLGTYEIIYVISKKSSQIKGKIFISLVVPHTHVLSVFYYSNFIHSMNSDFLIG